jgi:hypothetical protein
VSGEREPPAAADTPARAGGGRETVTTGGGRGLLRPGWSVRRIYVALDASPSSGPTARTSAELAARLSAELHGLYVVDTTLLRVADLPFARETGTYSATGRPLAPGDIERRFRSQAERARRLVAESAARAALASHRFEVLRGEVRRAIAEVAGDEDLLSLGRVGATGLHRLGGVAREVLARGRGQVLLLPASGRFDLPVLVVSGHTPGAHRALQAALRVLEHRAPGDAERDQRLVVLLATDDPLQAHLLEREARFELAAAGHDPSHARFHRASPEAHHALAHAVVHQRAGAVVLPFASPLVRRADLEEVVANLDCAVLLVR